MALIQVPDFFWPTSFSMASTYTNTANFCRLTNSGMRVAALINIPPSASGQLVKSIGWRTGTVTSGDHMRIGLYTCLTGTPTNTLYGGSSYVVRNSGTIASSTFYEDILATGTVLTPGDQVALVFEPDNFSQMSLYVATSAQSMVSYPLMLSQASSGASWSFTTQSLAYYLKSSSGTFLPTSFCAPSGVNTQSATSGAVIPEIGGIITVPFGCRVVGVWGGFGIQNSTINAVISLYNGSGQTLLTSQIIGGSTWPYSNTPVYPPNVYFPTPVVVSPNQQLTISIKSFSSILAAYCEYFTLANVGEEVAYRYPQGSTWISRSGVTWIQNPLQLARVGLIIDQIDNGVSISGGSGTITNNNVVGNVFQSPYIQYGQ